MKNVRALGMIMTLAIVCVPFVCSVSWAEGTNIVRFGEDVTVEPGTVVDDVVSVRSNIVVGGIVRGSCVAIGGTVYLKPGSSVAGEVVAIGGDVVRDPGAQVGGKITRISGPGMTPRYADLIKKSLLGFLVAFSFLMLLGFLGVVFLIVALVPRHMEIVAHSLQESFFVMTFWGILWSLLIVPLTLMLVVSIVGIILIPLEILLILLALLVGYVAAGLFIGKNISLSLRAVLPTWLEAIIGIVVLYVIGFIPIVGAIVKFVFLLAGFGAVLATRFGTEPRS